MPAPVECRPSIQRRDSRRKDVGPARVCYRFVMTTEPDIGVANSCGDPLTHRKDPFVPWRTETFGSPRQAAAASVTLGSGPLRIAG
jgi:hypothetical protein